MGSIRGIGFVIKSPDIRLVAAGSSRLFELSIPEAKLRVVWASIAYARLTLRANRLVIKNDSSTIIGWI